MSNMFGKLWRRRLCNEARYQVEAQVPLSIQRSSTQTQGLAESFVLYEGEKIADKLVTRVRIGPEVTVIPDDAFLGYTNLTEVQFTEGLKVIGQGAFQNCTALRSVTIPSSVTELGNEAFYGCKNLVELQLNEGLKIVRDEAFAFCKSLWSITIPSTVTWLGNGAFNGCSSLVELQKTESFEWIADGLITRVRINPEVTAIPDAAFLGDTNLTEVQLPEGLKVIGQGAFRNCKLLRSVTIPSTVTEWGSGAFTGCSSLVELKLNEGLQVIGSHAFRNCTALRSVTLPSSVAMLGSWAFFGCSSLVELQLNEGLQYRGYQAFKYCRIGAMPSAIGTSHGFSNLTEVILLGGERFMKQDFLAHGLFNEEPYFLNHISLDNILVVHQLIQNGRFVLQPCPLNTVKISINALSKRLARLPRECRTLIEERLQGLDRLEVTQDGTVLACFPVVRSNDTVIVQDTNFETAGSVHQFVRWIAFHELKESSILIELAMWKSKIDDSVSELPREDCLVAIPGPAKTAIMEYCGFADILKPASDCA